MKPQNDLDILDELVVDTILSNVKHEFDAIIGQIYFLYRKRDNTYFVSMVEPEYWTKYNFDLISQVKFTHEQSWMSVDGTGM